MQTKYYRVVYEHRHLWNACFGVEASSKIEAIKLTRPFMMDSYNSRYAPKYKKPYAYFITKEEFDEMTPYNSTPKVRKD